MPLGRKPTNQASRLSWVVPVLPAAGHAEAGGGGGAPVDDAAQGEDDLGVDVGRRGPAPGPAAARTTLPSGRIDPGDREGLDVHAAVGEGAVGRRHLEGRDLLGAEHEGVDGVELAVDAHAVGRASTTSSGPTSSISWAYAVFDDTRVASRG